MDHAPAENANCRGNVRYGVTSDGRGDHPRLLLFDPEAVVQGRASILQEARLASRTSSVASSILPPIVTGRPPAMSLGLCGGCTLRVMCWCGAGLEGLDDEHAAATPSRVSRRPITRRWHFLSHHSPAMAAVHSAAAPLDNTR
jgi:hypothetical protein